MKKSETNICFTYYKLIGSLNKIGERFAYQIFGGQNNPPLV